MKSDVPVNADGDNPKRVNQNILKYLKTNAWLNKFEDFKQKIFRPKVSFFLSSHSVQNPANTVKKLKAHGFTQRPIRTWHCWLTQSPVTCEQLLTGSHDLMFLPTHHAEPNVNENRSHSVMFGPLRSLPPAAN